MPRRSQLLLATILALLSALPITALAAPVDQIVIEKKNRQMKLLSGDKVVVEYSIALGRTPEGPKQCQGDGRTPEGDYQIASRNAQSSFHRSLRISYPSEKDRQLAAKLRCPPGGDIMIHGLPPSFRWVGAKHRLTDWTEGCIAVTDPEIEEIWRLVRDGTKVRILP